TPVSGRRARPKLPGMTASDRPSRPPRPVRAPRWVQGHRGATAAIALAFVGIVIGALALRAYFASYVATDDAQVDGHIAAIGARVAGTVLAVHVEENQPVRRGDLLVELDPRDLVVALARAQADLGLAKANLMAENPRLGIAQQSQATQVATSA